MAQSTRYKMTESSPHDLHWLHQFATIKCEVEGEAISYEVEDFGNYYDGDEEVLADVDEFLDNHSSVNLDLLEFLSVHVIHPIEYSIRNGVQDIAKSVEITRLRKRKAVFIINQIIPRIYYHDNFCEIQGPISRAVTGLLILIGTLNKIHPHDKEDVLKTTAFFKAKGFLASIALQIWSVCLYEQGISLVDRTMPCLRQLAMMDLLDESWKYAGSWENVFRLLEETHGQLPRIPADRAIDDCSNILRRARNSLRSQVLEIDGFIPSSQGVDGHQMPDQIFSYFPKCSAYLCSEIESPDKAHRLRCYKCNYYHWCSPACQQYSEEIAEHHELFCGKCPQEKAADCRAEMRDYLNIPTVNDQDNDERVKCHSCGLNKKLTKVMNRCSRCKAAHYCSRTCQAWDWTHGNHRNKCDTPV
jgi:hypothetical protein